MYNPFFSIVIVCLNAGTMLKMTLDSTLSQTNTEYEIIVKDGLSTDETLMYVPDDIRIKLISKKDKSIYDAMNQAIELTSGKYIIFMNCGDIFSSNTVLDEVKEGTGDNNFGMIIGDYKRDNVIRRQPEKITRFYMFRTPLCHQTIFFNGAILRNGNIYDISYKILADYNLELQILSKAVTKHINTVVCTYLGGGISESDEGKRLKKFERNKILRNHYSRIERIFYGFAWRLTLPSLRGHIANSRYGILNSTYHKIVNKINK